MVAEYKSLKPLIHEHQTIVKTTPSSTEESLILIRRLERIEAKIKTFGIPNNIWEANYETVEYITVINEDETRGTIPKITNIHCLYVNCSKEDVILHIQYTIPNSRNITVREIAVIHKSKPRSQEKLEIGNTGNGNTITNH